MTTRTGRKWALLVGIDRYPHLAADYQLQGCVNDVLLMQDLLCTKFGFLPENITLLTDSAASRDGILAALRALLEQVADQDLVVVHYSGHGSQRSDGPEQDEPDGLDETILPADTGRGADPNRDISDDEIYGWLLQITARTPHVTLIVDCCHSGTISRDAFGAPVRWVPPDLRPADAFPAPAFALPTQATRPGTRGAGGWLPLGERYVLLAACRDEESAYEIRENGLRHGALTYFLGQELSRAQSDSSYRDLFERVSALVTARYPRQHPQLEGSRDRAVLGVTEITPVRFVPVRERRGPRVTLAAGAAHGVTPGSRWAIYPAGAHRATGETPRLGTAVIDACRAVTAEAHLTEEAAENAVVAGARAVEEAHVYGAMRPAVEIRAAPGFAPAVKALREEFRASPLLQVTDGSAEAQIRIYLLPPRTAVAPGDPVPQIRTLDRPTWAAVGADGKLMMPLHGVAEPDAPAVIRENLEKSVRHAQVLRLHNHAGGLLAGKIGFTLLRQWPGHGWVEAVATEGIEENGAMGLAVFTEGERIGARITNHFGRPVFVSVLDLGLSGAVHLLHPIAGASEELLPGKSLEMGTRPGDEIVLALPDRFPFAPDPMEPAPAGGVETFKLLATTRPADFSWLESGPLRAPASAQMTRLEQLLALAYTGAGTRDARRNQVTWDEEWTTVERVFYLRSDLIG